MPKIGVNKIRTLTGHNDCVYSLEASGQENQFFSGAGDGLVAVWDLNDSENGELLVKVSTSIYALHYMEERELLVVGENYSGIHLVDLKTRKEISSLKLTESAIFDITSYQDKLIVADGGGTIFILNVAPLQLLNKIKLSEKSARALAINPLERHLAVGYSDHKIRIFSLDNQLKLIKEINAHNNSVFTLKYDPDFRFLLSGSRDAHLKVWKVEQDYGLFEDIVAHMYTINNIEYSPDGSYFCTCSMDKSIKVWHAGEFRLLKVIDKARHAGHGTSVNKLLWTTYQNQVISCSDDRTISIWDLKFNQEQ